MKHTMTFTDDELNVVRLALDEYYYQGCAKIEDTDHSIEYLDKWQERVDIASKLYKKASDELWGRA